MDNRLERSRRLILRKRYGITTPDIPPLEQGDDATTVELAYRDAEGTGARIWLIWLALVAVGISIWIPLPAGTPGWVRALVPTVVLHLVIGPALRWWYARMDR